MESKKITITDFKIFSDEEINDLIEEINDIVDEEDKIKISLNNTQKRIHLKNLFNKYPDLDKDFLNLYRNVLDGSKQTEEQTEKQTEEPEEQDEKLEQTEKQPKSYLRTSEYQITEDPEFSNGLISEEFEKNPFKGFVDLKDKNEIQIKQIGEKLKQIYETKIKTTALNQKINIGFYVKGE